MSNLMNSNDLEQLAEHAQEAAALLKQLSNQHRLMILCSLIDSELSVTELNSRTNLISNNWPSTLRKRPRC